MRRFTPTLRFTTVSLLTEHEPIPEPAESVQTVTLGPTHVTTCLVNSDRLPSPKMPQTVSLSPQTGTTGSDLSSPDQMKSFQASPLVRGVLERSQEGIDRLERSGKGSGLVGWATKSFRRMSTPKSANRKKLPIPHSPTSPHFSPHGLKRCRIVCLFVCLLFVCLPIYRSEQAQNGTTKLPKPKRALLSFKKRSTVRRFTDLFLSLRV